MTAPRRGSPSPSAPSRRTVLRGAAGLGAALAVAGAATACSTDDPSADDRLAQRLAALVQEATRQQQDATRLGPTETSYSAALARVAVERGEHAKALTDEVRRLSASTAASISSTPPATSGSPGAGASSLDDLRAGLESSARTAATAASEMDGYRAGLLGSISAACTALREVQLA
ncbi:MAG: hypothetical protein QM658_12735 [Gordonia sp. (in: high G+C Gram-positive bacteria)]